MKPLPSLRLILYSSVPLYFIYIFLSSNFNTYLVIGNSYKDHIYNLLPFFINVATDKVGYANMHLN